MSETSIQTATPPAGAASPANVASALPPTTTHTRRPSPLYRAIRPLASLRLTVVLFALSLGLVFFGTLAQIDNGVWTVVSAYFRSFFVWVPFQLLVQFGMVFFGLPRDLQVSGSFPFPGGWLLGGLLLVNLLAAHTVRFKISWKRTGILLTHAGLIILLLGELVTGVFAVEGRMMIFQGGSANYVTHARSVELAVVTPLPDGKTERVTVVPGSLLRRGGTISHPDLPFDVEVVRFMTNARLQKADGETDNPATRGEGKAMVAVAQPEVSGVAEKQVVDTPAAYLTFTDKNTGASLGTWMVAIEMDTRQPLKVDGKTYDVSLRFHRLYKPYTMHLLQFRHDRYPGTDIPKNYSSLVRLEDADSGEKREALIRMNEPLRYRGDTYYQADFDHDSPVARYTVLQVVRNPGWLMPYISCAVVALGLILHFGLHLITFLRRRIAA